MTAPELLVFVSFAAADRELVAELLLEPLARCRNADGHSLRPVISHNAAGESQLAVAERALKTCKHIVAAYSESYFRDDVCGWELTKALELDPVGREGRLVPVLLEPRAARLVPFRVSHITAINVGVRDGLLQVCERLGVKLPPAQARLRFVESPNSVRAGETVGAVRVEVLGGDADAELSIALDEGQLRGTLQVRSVNCVASFVDLVVAQPANAVRFVVRGAGAPAATGPAFTVRPETSCLPVAASQGVLLPAVGEAVFFEDNSAVAVLTDEAVEVFDLGGPRLAEVTFGSPVRLVRRAGQRLAIAEWSGRVHVLTSVGETRVADLAAGRHGYTVVSDIAFAGNEIWAGTWEGSVYRLVDPPVREICHAAGVQVLNAHNRGVVIGGLDGTLAVYEDQRLVFSYPLERSLHLAFAKRDGVVIVGESKGIYVLTQRGGSREVLRDKLPFPTTAHAMAADDNWFVLTDANGQVAILDANCVIRTSFRFSADARPLSAARGANALVLGLPDGSRSFFLDGRSRLSQAKGTLALSPNGKWLAAAVEEGVRLVRVSDALGGWDGD